MGEKIESLDIFTQYPLGKTIVQVLYHRPRQKEITHSHQAAFLQKFIFLLQKGERGGR